MSATENRSTQNVDAASTEDVAQLDGQEMTEGERLAEEGSYAPQERTPQEKASIVFGLVFLLVGAGCWVIFL